MADKNKKRMALFFSLAIFFVILDRFFKVLALKKLNSNTYELIGEWLKFDFEKNYYIAFSIPFSGLFLNAFIILIILLLLFFLVKNYNKLELFIIYGLTFFLFGAISNMFDRLVYGYVIDYIYLKYFTVFNLADAMIVISGLSLIFINFFKKEKNV